MPAEKTSISSSRNRGGKYTKLEYSQLLLLVKNSFCLTRLSCVVVLLLRCCLRKPDNFGPLAAKTAGTRHVLLSASVVGRHQPVNGSREIASGKQRESSTTTRILLNKHSASTPTELQHFIRVFANLQVRMTADWPA